MRIACRFATGLTVAASTALSAATNLTDQVFTNAPIVVSASRAGRTAAEMPAHVAVITAAAIQDTGVQSVPEALERLGGVYFRKYSSNPGQADIALRGFGENSHGRVLVLIDGQRLNNADMSSVNWLNVPVGSVERIELIRGSQTALYGNYAVAGVVNIITRDGAEAPATTVSASAGSDDTYGAHLGTAGTLDAATRYTADADWQRSDGTRANSGYETTDLRATVTEQLLDRLSITLGAFYNRNTYGLPGYLTFDEMRGNPRQTHTPNDRTKAESFGGHLGLTGNLGPDATFDLNLTASRRDSTGKTISWYSQTETALETFAAAPRLTVPFEVAGMRDRLVIGIDAAYDKLDCTTAKLDYDYPLLLPPTPSVAADLRRWSLGGYIQNELAFTEQLSLILGGRVERCGYQAEIDDLQVTDDLPVDETVVHPRSALDIALLFHPTPDTKLYARAATLYRYPFLDEMAIYSGYAPPEVNVDLGPEKGTSVEIGGAGRFVRDWTAELSVYQLDMSDEIAYDGTRNVNLNETRRRGGEAVLAWSRPGIGLLSASYAYVDASFTSGVNNGRTVPLVPSHVLTLRGELPLPCDFALLAGAHLVGNQHLGGDIDNSITHLDRFATADLGLRFAPRQVAGLQLLLNLDNVFDQRYASMAFEGNPEYDVPDAYYPAAGRTWRLTASYRF
jgi:iron complex outermembrane receptor protein